MGRLTPDTTYENKSLVAFSLYHNVQFFLNFFIWDKDFDQTVFIERRKVAINLVCKNALSS